MQDVDNLFLEAGRAIDNSDLSSAKSLLNEILLIDPAHSRAHNHLGWIYETKLKDFEKAQMHYELAIKFSKGNYPVVYVNFVYLLIEYGHYDRAGEVIEEAMDIQGVDYATLIFQKGQIAESHQKFIDAAKNYMLARKLTFSKELMNVLDNEIKRVKSKMNFWQKLLFRLDNF
ncbi:MAG: hypothetical protein PHO74_08865 [Weeksellaceae bacterium]|jgi:Tfp pilus assembly protein PilF|nr:hypothetical protein [Weeksellaceae bacterium]